MARSLYIALCAVLVAAASAQFFCCGQVANNRMITSDVIVQENCICTLTNTNVGGSVHLRKGAGVSTFGESKVFGQISGTDCGAINLQGNIQVSGGVSLTRCTSIDVGKGANVASVSVWSVNSLVLQGTTALLGINGKVDLFISGGTITGGGINRQNTVGSTNICGGKIWGGIKLTNNKGAFNAAAGGGCAPSEISGTIEIVKSEGAVNIGGGQNRGADFILAEHKGSATVYSTTVSDVAIKSVQGNIKLDGLVADSDAGINGVSGTITVTKSSFDGDFGVIGNPGNVVINDNDFTLEDLLINGNGDVSITNNKNFSFAVSENKKVNVYNNQGVTTASINKNTQVSIGKTDFEGVSCTDNGAISVTAVNTALFPTGQCSSIANLSV